MSAFPDLWLMRHGETVWNAEGRLQGAHDSPLTPRGQRQADWQAALVAGLPGLHLASPQGRAVATARIVFPDGFTCDPALREIGLGTAAGRLMADLERERPGLFGAGDLGWYDALPGGEGLAALETRMAGFLARLTGPVLIVSHGITLRMIWALVTGAGRSRLHEAPVDQGRVLALRGGVPQVLRHPEDCG
ncbi:histidine phosphatase family protein [Paracoccus sp. (in: a-proteobacteria)]|uniref:histidine phosphatase family protein n=1 Tax=Paracoccus sp. TaxID=267 RepID=UPI00272AA96E|nr:histidine phosphatase family protein [Paracoccus sp. (in: a-proteobacteria)]